MDLYMGKIILFIKMIERIGKIKMKGWKIK